MVLNFPFIVPSYVLYVTAFLVIGISDNICATVCMQDKFEPTSVLLSECLIVCTRHKSLQNVLCA